MLKHIGRHGTDKIVIVFNTVPGEDHMALVAYSGRLPVALHDEVMKVIESNAGQGAKQLSDALYRHIMPDGRNTLHALHQGGYLKKVQTKQIILTPNAKTNIRLDELNDILAKMELGQDAIKKMEDLEKSKGFADNKKIDGGRDVGEINKIEDLLESSPSVDGLLSDEDLARSRLNQAQQFRVQADSLIAEAKRLEAEAKQLTPKVKNGRKTTTKEKA
jgi:hypothetical protein